MLSPVRAERKCDRGRVLTLCDPGSQSTNQVHTGHFTQESFHTDSANIDRALNALGKFVDEFTREEYDGVVKA